MRPTTSISTTTCSSASPATSLVITCAMTSRALEPPMSPRPGTRSTTPWSWKEASRACRERRSAAKPTASGRKFRIWSRRNKAARAARAPFPADLDSHIVDQPSVADLCCDQQADRPVLVGADWRESLGVARLEVVEDEARALDDAATLSYIRDERST